ncbi:hypothetical protein HanIR_Chr17g0856231 [Helianthus annuus]|nr:hypothetical protein HanIR_Chr17g0856231 [Helianthus annuus]
MCCFCSTAIRRHMCCFCSTAIRRHMCCFCSSFLDHPQHLLHYRSIFWDKRNTHHGDIQKSREFLLRRLIPRGRWLITRFCFFFSYSLDPFGYIRPMFQNKVLERCFTGEKLQEKDAEAVDVCLLGDWFSWVTTFWGAVEEGSSAWFFGEIRVCEWR